MRSTHAISGDPWREELPRLRVFEEVVRAKSFTVAARSLGLSQPATSRAVAKLEEHLGAKLLEREGREVRLTKAGESVFASARRVRDELEKLGAEIGRDGTDPRGDYVCFAAEHAASRLLASPMASLVRRFPLLVPRVVTGPAHLAVSEIAEDRAEVGFFFKVEPHARIEARPIASFACKLVSHPDAADDAEVLESFIGSREIDHRRNTAFPTVDMLRRHRSKTKITYSSNNLGLHKEWVRSKVGISILPLFVVEGELARRELRVVHPEWVYWAHLLAVVRKGRVLNLASRMLLKDVRARCRALGAQVPARTSAE
jgi:DNA-binding transcriptional LysR family regulator